MIQKKISKILVPLDGSKNSVRGLETAITLARSCDATITGIPGELYPEIAVGGIESPKGADFAIEPQEVPPAGYLSGRGDRV